MSEKVKVKILRGFCLGQGVDVYPGDVVELPKTTAAIEVHRGRAVLTDEKLGKAAPVQTRGGIPLAGSNVQPPEIVNKKGKPVQIGSVVAAAHKASGLSVEEWNALEESKREELIADAVKKIKGEG